MLIPLHIDRPRTSKADRATARLKYIFKEFCRKQRCRSMREFGKKVGIDHSTLSYHIKDGACSERTAMLLARHLGLGLEDALQLCDPLSIPTEKAV